MHATQPQGGAGPEPARPEPARPEPRLFGTVTPDGIFTLIRVEVPADRRCFDLREAGWTGWIDQDGYATDQDGERYDLGTCQRCGRTGIPVQLVVTDDGERIVCADPG